MKTKKVVAREDSDTVLIDQQMQGNQDKSVMAVLANGEIVICWTDHDPHGDESGASIKARIFDAEGRPLTDEFLVNSVRELDQFDPAIAATSDGGFVVTWTSGDLNRPDSRFRISAQQFGEKGEAIGGEIKVWGERFADTHATVTALADGRFAIGWHASANGGDVVARLFDREGGSTDPFRLTEALDGDQHGMKFAALNSESFVAVWASTSERDGDEDGLGISGQIFDAKGTPVGDPIHINADVRGDQNAPEIVSLGERGFAVAWTTKGDDGLGIDVRLFDPKGTPLGDDEHVAIGLRTSADPLVAATADGGLVVAWLADGALHAQLVNMDGKFVGDPLLVTLPEGSAPLDPSLVAMADGSFVLSWTETNEKLGDGSGSAIVAQGFTLGDPPIAEDDHFSFNEDQQFRVKPPELLDNDRRGPGGEIHLVAVGNATHGTVFLDDDGVVTFTPDADFSGQASFDYRIADEHGLGSVATVILDVNPVDDAPVAVDDAIAVTEDQIVVGSVATNDHDIDSAGLTYALASPLAGLTLAADGSFTFDAGDPAWQSLAEGQIVQENVAYVVTDPEGATSVATLVVTLTGRNDAPTLVSYAAIDVAENAAAGTAAGSVAAADPEDDAITYSLSNDADGRFVIDATTGAISVADGAVLDYETDHRFLVTVHMEDALGAGSDAIVRIRLVDQAETIVGDVGADRLLTPAHGVWTLEGLAGDDTLVATAGGNTLVGGADDDSYIVRASGVTLVEADGGGTDTVTTTLGSFTLGNWIENLRASGRDGLDGTGNGLANALTGGVANDHLAGLGGDDKLVGGDGADRLEGGDGADILTGGAGADTMTGGAGADRFRLLAVSDSTAGDATLDHVTDFSHAERDRIDLSRIDAVSGVSGSSFGFIGNHVFDHVAGELRYEATDTGVIVQGDLDGNGVADFSLAVDGVSVLLKGDFVL